MKSRTNALLFALLYIIFLVDFSFPQNDNDDDQWDDKCTPGDTMSVCQDMAPRDSKYTEQDPSTCPWKIFLYKDKIQQYFSHPVVLGSKDGKEIFSNYILAAKSITDGHIVGHFEHQWDAIPVCCYFDPDRDYSYEGPNLHPNLLYGSYARVLKPNQTVLWTAPKGFEGTIVFEATFSKSSQVYWKVTSDQVEVIKRDFTSYPFNFMNF